MKNKTVLISGATSGIGRATVFELLENGFFVSGFAPDSKKCKALAKELARSFKPGQFLITAGDVTKESSLKKVIRSTVSKFKNIDIVVNNAGYGFFVEPEAVDINQYRRMMDVNMVGMATLTKLVVPQMKKKKMGHIVNVASIAGRTVGFKGSFYSSTKFAVMGYSEGIRKDLEPFNIKVSTVCPGMVQTDFFTKKELARRKKELWNGKVPVMLNSADIAKAICFVLKQPTHVEIRDILVMPFGN